MHDTNALIIQTVATLTIGNEAEAEACVVDALTNASHSGANPEDVAAYHNEWADRRFTAGRYDETTGTHYEVARRLFEAAHPDGHPDVANVLNNLAALAQARGCYAGALEYAYRASAITGRILERIESGTLKVDDDVAAAIRQIQRDALAHTATALRSEGRYTEAETHYRKVLALTANEFGDDSAEAACSYANLGVLCNYAGRYDEAADHYERALTITNRLRLRETANGSNLLYNLGGLAHARGRFAEAEPFAREALAIAERVVGTAHPDFAVKLIALAAILEGLHRYDEAEQTGRRALDILTATFGMRHPDVALTLSNLAAVVEAQGRYNEAEALYRKGLQVRQELLGSDHPQVALGLNNLGALLRDRGRYDEARICYERALAVFERFHGPQHPHTLACRQGYARLLEVASQDARGCASLDSHTTAALVAHMG